MSSKPKIVVRITCIIINDYEYGSCLKLENTFRMYDMITHSCYYLGLYYEEETKTLFLPRGIDLWWIQNCFEGAEPVFEDPDEYETFSKMNMKYKPRDDIQKEALRFMLGVNEYTDNKNYSMLATCLSTGKGKSYVSIYTMAYAKMKSCVITYSNGWLDQWRDYILEYTDLENTDIHQISGAQSINMLLSGKSKYQKCKIFLITHSTIKSYGDTYGWDKISKLFKLLKIGMNFVDEAHLNFANLCMISFFTNVYKTYLITATPARSDQTENKIYQLSLKNIPKIDLFDPDNDPHTDYIALKWNSKPSPQQISNCRNPYGLDRNKYVNYVVNQPEFYKMLHVVMRMALKHNGRCLFYVGTNDAIIKIYNWIANNYPEYLGDIGIYTTLTSDTKPEEKKKKLILSTTKSAGAAEHIEGLKMTVVLAEPFKSEVIARQTLGRTRDDNTLYVELIDLAFKPIKRYYYSKLPIFNKYAKSVSDINLSPYELEEQYGKIIGKRDRVIKRNPLRLSDNRFQESIVPFHQIEEEDNKIRPLYFYNEPL